MKKAYLFKIKLWWLDPYEYVLAYGETEKEARIAGAKPLEYNSGDKVEPHKLELITYGL